jgi:3-oxo-5-alpha-steroid 4-dehydrogenase 1
MGIVLFLVGAAINIDSDARLRRLRVVAAASAAAKKTSESTTTPLNPDSSKNHRSKYAIPHGAFFEYVSTPHYFGEIVEWTGFCIASNYSLASVAFVVYTAANLIPRGVAHHAWYQATFDNYPSNRKAVIPFLW